MSLNREKCFVYEIIKIRIWFEFFQPFSSKSTYSHIQRIQTPTTRRRRARDGSLDARPGHRGEGTRVNAGGAASASTPSQTRLSAAAGRAAFPPSATLRRALRARAAPGSRAPLGRPPLEVLPLCHLPASLGRDPQNSMTTLLPELARRVSSDQGWRPAPWARAWHAPPQKGGRQ